MRNVLPFESGLEQNTQLIGTVILMEGNTAKVRTDAGLLTARCSASCLLTPSEGDRVHLLRDSQSVYLINVLEKADATVSKLAVEGKLLVSASQLDLQAEEAVSVRGQTLDIEAAEGSFKFGVFTQLAHKLSWVAERMNMTASRLHRQAKREHILVEQQHERVTDSKNIQAGRFLQRVHKQWIARSERTTVTAKKEVKLDGSRIDLG